MAALRQLILSLERISLTGVSSSSAVRCHSQLPISPVISCQTTPVTYIQRCCLHLSAIHARQMDSRRVEPSREPSSKKNRWVERKKMSDMYEYTTEPLPFPRTGGRGPNGRIWNHARGGGLKKHFYMIDWVRGGPQEGPPLIEKVKKIMSDPNRSAHIALVASGEHKRYVIATQNMKKGDLIKSSRLLSKAPVRAEEGDAYPVGSLPIGSLVSSVEMFPDKGSHFARSAGVTALLVRKTDQFCYLRLPSKREVAVSPKCVATVGRVSNIDHDKRVLGKAGARRWLGFRPSSGRWHRKTGRFGRKIRATPATRVYEKESTPRPAVYRIGTNHIIPKIPYDTGV